MNAGLIIFTVYEMLGNIFSGLLFSCVPAVCMNLLTRLLFAFDEFVLVWQDELLQLSKSDIFSEGRFAMLWKELFHELLV